MSDNWKNSGIAKVLFILVVIIIYGNISTLSFFSYLYYFGVNTVDLERFFEQLRHRPLIAILFSWLNFYIYIYLAFYNLISLLLFLIWASKIKKKSFIAFLGINLTSLLISYSIGFLIFPFIETWNALFILHNVPRVFGDKTSGNFIGNIILGSFFFYSWFLPLWYYKLGDWFWNRGTYKKG